MGSNSILIIGGEQIRSLLEGRELEIVDAVQSAYMIHAAGKTSLPHSLFLSFPENPGNRIIALPAYLPGERPRAGLKWIASFPGNVSKGMDRASAVIVLNSPETGIPEAILEGSIISAKRTAASAALAARYLCPERPYQYLGLVGSGLINHEICRFLKAVCPSIAKIVMFDKDQEKAARVAPAYAKRTGISDIHIASHVEEVLHSCDVVSFATTASTPYVRDLSRCRSGSTVLHVSLRDLEIEAILSGDNVVDDADHVCRAGTSLHLTEQHTGNRDFIRCSLAAVIAGQSPPRRHPDSVAIFNPFGLGILDLAVADLALSVAHRQHQGTCVASFLPTPWLNGLNIGEVRQDSSDLAGSTLPTEGVGQCI